jgi:hypothetical protein
MTFRENVTTPIKKTIERSHVTDDEIVGATGPDAGFPLADERVRRIAGGDRTKGGDEAACRGWLVLIEAGHSPNLSPFEDAKKPWAAIGPLISSAASASLPYGE